MTDKKPMTIEEIFSKCQEIFNNRKTIRGTPENSFPVQAKLVDIFLNQRDKNKPIGPDDVSMIYALLKIGRELNGRDDDNIIDAIVYLAIYLTQK
ncbi:DUF6378 domain-containing protein [bacterium]|nr:DUF6378 domain-containing protein [bacterium]